MTAGMSIILTLLQQLLPLITTSGNAAVIGNVITALTNILPLVVSEVETLIPPIKNIIAALSASPATTAEQLATLQALDAQADAAFEAAAAATDAGT
jgi:hypothetical protein